MSRPAPALSIIIPLAAGETLWQPLLRQLPCATGDEILLAAGEAPPPGWQDTPTRRWLHCRRRGRAAQMNDAAAAAQNGFLWFVHADSRFAADAADCLRTALREQPQALHYFALRFYDGGWKMRINELGVRLRCQLFANPFGDQALCLAKPLFEALGGYDETAPYGEDHLLVLRAHRRGTPLRSLPAAVATSARRYTQQGWWRTVLLYQMLWWRQWRQQQP